MTTACDLPIDLSTKSQHHHSHHHGLQHGRHLAFHHRLVQLDQEQLHQLQCEYLNQQQLSAALANHPLNRLYAVSQHQNTGAANLHRHHLEQLERIELLHLAASTGGANNYQLLGHHLDRQHEASGPNTGIQPSAANGVVGASDQFSSKSQLIATNLALNVSLSSPSAASNTNNNDNNNINNNNNNNNNSQLESHLSQNHLQLSHQLAHHHHQRLHQLQLAAAAAAASEGHHHHHQHQHQLSPHNGSLASSNSSNLHHLGQLSHHHLDHNLSHYHHHHHHHQNLGHLQHGLHHGHHLHHPDLSQLASSASASLASSTLSSASSTSSSSSSASSVSSSSSSSSSNETASPEVQEEGPLDATISHHNQHNHNHHNHHHHLQLRTALNVASERPYHASLLGQATQHHHIESAHQAQKLGPGARSSPADQLGGQLSLATNNGDTNVGGGGDVGVGVGVGVCAGGVAGDGRNENPSPIDLHRSSTSSTVSTISSPSSSSASITSTSSLSGNLQLNDKKRINRPLTGKHVKHGTGASIQTLVTLRKVIRQRQQQLTGVKA